MTSESQRPALPDSRRVACAVEALVRAAAADEEAFRGLALVIAGYCAARAEAESSGAQLRAHGTEPLAAFVEDRAGRAEPAELVEELTPWQRQLVRGVLENLPRPEKAGPQIERLVKVVGAHSEEPEAYRREATLLAAAMIRLLLDPTLGSPGLRKAAAWLFQEDEGASEG